MEYLITNFINLGKAFEGLCRNSTGTLRDCRNYAGIWVTA